MITRAVGFVRYCIAAADAERPGAAGALAIMFAALCGLVIVVGLAALSAL